MADLHAAVKALRDSKARWGSYAIDHDAIDALADLLEAVDPLGYAMGASKAETLALHKTYDKAQAFADAIAGQPPSKAAEPDRTWPVAWLRDGSTHYHAALPGELTRCGLIRAKARQITLGTRQADRFEPCPKCYPNAEPSTEVVSYA